MCGWRRREYIKRLLYVVKSLRCGDMTRPPLALATADAALADIPEGARIVAGNACGTPLTLLRALGRRAASAGSVTLTLGITLGEPQLADAARSGAVRLRAWHVHGELRGLFKEGLVDYVPLRLIDVPRVILDETDVALLRVGAPDERGYCSLGPSASYALDAVRRARLVIAEVADDVPRLRGDGEVHVSQLNRLVASDVPMAEYAPVAPTAVSAAVAANVAALIPDGSTVQLGIGAIGDAVAEELSRIGDAKSLRLHGMISDPMMPLVDAIAAAGGAPVVAVELLGSPALMAWADGNAALELRDSQRVHHPVAIADIGSFVSVNSAVAVDLAGQVVAETVRGGVISGVGGSADFAEGAHLSVGGMRVIALASTTARGDSTIVAAHAASDLITATHYNVDAVVTEHGIALLRGRGREERAAALRAIAAPAHREALG
jgi:4-hydroxybutyrate CoA-transferase